MRFKRDGKEVENEEEIFVDGKVRRRCQMEENWPDHDEKHERVNEGRGNAMNRKLERTMRRKEK
jgi:hypothetical protein